eukprot:Skav219672  [mRNA]  locus=scaffold3149:113084:120619:+ [translate_table: standard]
MEGAGQSPVASPHGGSQPIDGAEVARMMIAATEAASQAAQSAANALQQLSAKPKDTDWFKLVPKPSAFSPQTREEEIGQWKDWWWSVEQFLATIDQGYEHDVDNIKNNLDTEIVMVNLLDDDKKRSLFLYSLLASLLKGRLLSILKGVPQNNGYEALRQLLLNCQPSSRNRSLGLLNAVMAWPSFNMKHPLLGQILKLEQAFQEYARIASAISEEIRFAVLLRCVGGQLRTYLNVNISEKSTYAELREAILRYDRATVKWSESMVLGADDAQPMDVDDRVAGKEQKGNPKGKKGDQKGNKSNPGKGKGFEKGKGHGGYQNSYGQNFQKSSGKGKDKGKNPEKGKSKGKGKETRTCHLCKKVGHLAKDCWSKDSVRQVQGDGESSVNVGALSTVSGTSSLPGVNPSHSASNVRRVQNTQSVVFDLRDDTDDASSSSHVRAVHFFIGDECEAAVPAGPLKDPCDFHDFEDYEEFYEYLYFQEKETVVNLENTFEENHGCSAMSWISAYEPAEDKHVRAVTFEDLCDEVEIILDSGSDATVLPLDYSRAGQATSHVGMLWDAQGSRIATYGCRDVSIEFVTEDGMNVSMKDRGHVSEKVQQPLLSFGRLLKRGWGIVIDEQDNRPKLYHFAKGLKIPIEYKNDSLVVMGKIRRVGMVRVVPADALPADIPKRWSDATSTWGVTSQGFPLKCTRAKQFVDPSRDFSLDEWGFRTSFGWDGRQWYLLEFCQDVKRLGDRSEELEGRWQRLVTVLTSELMPPERMGFACPEFQSSEPAGAQRPAESSDVGIVEQPGAGVGGDEPMQQAEGERAEGAQPAAQAEVPEVPERQELIIKKDTIELAGITVTSTSSLALLRNSCKYMGISQSGSKDKLWRRLSSKVDEHRLNAARDIAVQVQDEAAREPVMQTMTKPPDDYREVEAHNLTHLPYAPWCLSCVKAKGRPDSHVRDAERHTKREYPTISFDLKYTSKEVEGEDSKDKILVMVMTCSQTGAISAVPFQDKSDAFMMSKEVCRFIQWLGHHTLALRCDQEPTMLKVEDLARRALVKMNYTVHLENSKIYDSASNALAENAIHRIRQTATVLQLALEENLCMQLPTTHALTSWSYIHASFLINRFVCKGGVTPFEVVCGRGYTGKLAQFGEPVLAWTYKKPGPKGGSRWTESIFLSKTMTHDMFIVGCEGTIRLTRSIKRMFPDWTALTEMYQKFIVDSWLVEVKGSTLNPRVRPRRPEPVADEVQSGDEAASDPATEDEQSGDEQQEVTIPNDATLASLVKRDGPLTPVPVAATPKPVVAPASVAPRARVGAQAMEVEAPQTPGVVRPADELPSEPAAKRPRLETRQVAGEEFSHLDETIEMDYDFQNDFDNFWDSEYFEQFQVETKDESERLWFPKTSDAEPQLSDTQLDELDQLADMVEIERLEKMGVIARPDKVEKPVGSKLSAKFVRTWRCKVREGAEFWLRRSRLVAREFNFMENRYDVFAPASSTSSQRILPALALNGSFSDKHVLGSLDITDAYLMVDQEQPRKVVLSSNFSSSAGDDFGWIILKVLPGQRDGARKWYDHFLQTLKDEFAAKPCEVQPAIVKIPGHGCLLMHVDDIMFLFDEKFLLEEFSVKLKKKYKMTMEYAGRNGGQFSFLKKLYVVDVGYERISICPEVKHIVNAYNVYTMHNGKPPRLFDTPVNNQLFEKDHTEPMTPSLSGVFRSLVGALLYVSHERSDIQFATKNLASYLSSPTKHSWMMLGRLIGYLKKTERVTLEMVSTSPHNSLFAKLNGATDENPKILIESFSDADWNVKSTSSGVHYISGNLVFSSARTQKAISLSSTASEWYAALSTAIDAMQIKHIVMFLCGDCELILRVDNSAVVSISTKLGTSRLKHIEGKLLWLQHKVAEKVLQLRPVGTNYNTADVGTKGLARNKHNTMMYLLGMYCDGKAVGEHEYQQLCESDVKKKVRRMMVRRLIGGEGLENSAVSLLLTLLAQSVPVTASSDVMALGRCDAPAWRPASWMWRSWILLALLGAVATVMVLWSRFDSWAVVAADGPRGDLRGQRRLWKLTVKFDEDELKAVDSMDFAVDKVNAVEKKETAINSNVDERWVDYFMEFALVIFAVLMAVFYMHHGPPGGHGTAPYNPFRRPQGGGGSFTSQEDYDRAEQEEWERRKRSLAWTYVLAKDYYLTYMDRIPRKKMRLVLQAIHHANVGADSGEENLVDDFLRSIRDSNNVLLSLRLNCGDEYHSPSYYEHYLVRNLKWVIRDEIMGTYGGRFDMMLQNLLDKYLNMDEEPDTPESVDSEPERECQEPEAEEVEEEEEEFPDPFAKMNPEAKAAFRRAEDRFLFGDSPESEGYSPDVEALPDGGETVEVVAGEVAYSYVRRRPAGAAGEGDHAGEGGHSGVHGSADHREGPGDDDERPMDADGEVPRRGWTDIRAGEWFYNLMGDYSDDENVDYRALMAQRAADADAMVGMDDDTQEDPPAAADGDGEEGDHAAADVSLRRVRPRLDVVAEWDRERGPGGFMFEIFSHVGQYLR